MHFRWFFHDVDCSVASGVGWLASGLHTQFEPATGTNLTSWFTVTVWSTTDRHTVKLLNSKQFYNVLIIKCRWLLRKLKQLLMIDRSQLRHVKSTLNGKWQIPEQNKQSVACEALRQHTHTPSALGQSGLVAGLWSDSSVGLCLQDYKSPHFAVMISAALVNTQTDSFDWLYCYFRQLKKKFDTMWPAK